MKKCLFLTVILIISASFSHNAVLNAQGQNRPYKVDELEKVKLIESLNLDENTAIKFFARKQERVGKVNDLNRQRDDKMNQLQRAYEKGEKNEKFYRETISDLQGIDQNIIKIKYDFINSLSDILNPQQVAKYVVFERNFKREIKDLLMQKGKRKKD
jgi:hypothetical protein